MKAYIFPGQGAQFTGMGLDLYTNSKKTEKELDNYKSEKISLDILLFENQKLREQLDDYLVSTEVIFSKIIIFLKYLFQK